MGIKNIILGIAILVLTILVTWNGVGTIFPAPEYYDFCPEVTTQEYINNEAQCLAAGGQWTDYGTPKPVDQNVTGYCDKDFTCRKAFEDATKIRARNVFFLALPVGVAIIAIGAFFFGLEAVGAGLMGGGIATLIYGSGVYWQYTENWVRFALSLAGLVFVIWFAYFWNKRAKKGKRRR